jgi:small acid-soluble spore protein D (minor alpha/beta-type SASP)
MRRKFYKVIPTFPIKIENSKYYRPKTRISSFFRVKLHLRYPTSNGLIQRKGEMIMSSKNSNKLNVPEARAAMDKFKMEAASEVGVDLKEGYNGHLTSREAGSVGGQMVKKMIESYEKNL